MDEFEVVTANTAVIAWRDTPPLRSRSPYRRSGRWSARWIGGAVALALLGTAGPARAGDMDEIKETQKKILERLDAQDKTLKDILQRLQPQPAAAGRPQLDPNKVYTIALGASPIRGPKNAPVTMYEFSDYQ